MTTTPPETLAKVLVSELRIGDLVLNYGMRIRLVGLAVSHYTDDPAFPCYSFAGHVENADELRARPNGHVTDGLLPTDNSWRVQSNDRCRWNRVDTA